MAHTFSIMLRQKMENIHAKRRKTAFSLKNFQYDFQMFLRASNIHIHNEMPIHT